MVTIRDPQSIVNLQIVMTEEQVNAWRSRGYMKLEELRALPKQVEQLRQQVEDQQRRLEDQANLISSLRRQAG
jgi:division protein CdvB (Snf7/Vps24/ESCRT-III family)